MTIPAIPSTALNFAAAPIEKTAEILNSGATPSLVQNLAIVLLAALVAGAICKRIGLSVIVGYLLAGVIIGPNLPLHLITDAKQIDDLAQVGLVFVMFAIGMNLSLAKLKHLGLPTILATLLCAIFVFVLVRTIWPFTGYPPEWSLYIASMLMVSSSAVIAKIIEELRLSRDKTAQMALGVTVCEDIVAVVMMTILTAVGGSAVAAQDAPTAATIAADAPAAVAAVGEIGGVFARIGAYVTLILALSIFALPRLLKRLDLSGDDELRTVGVAGVLLMLAVCATKAGFSTALGAFLFGAIVGGLPQKDYIEKSFDSERGMFGAVFFVSIGMMADPRGLADATALKILALLLALTFVGRALAAGFALTLVGMEPKEAKRAGLLLTPLGEFTFIIAQQGISAKVLGEWFNPVAIALSVLTVILAPLINRNAATVANFLDRIEPPFISRPLNALHEWVTRLRERPPSKTVLAEARAGLFRIALEMLIVTGTVKFFAPPLLAWLSKRVRDTVSNTVAAAEKAAAAKTAGTTGSDVPDGALSGAAQTAGGILDGLLQWLATGLALETVFWLAVGTVCVLFLTAIARQTWDVAGVFGRGLAGRFLPERPLRILLALAAGAALLVWLLSILPFSLNDINAGAGDYGIIGINRALPLGMRALLLLVLAGIAIFGGRKLVAWHSDWQRTVAGVLQGGDAALAAATAREDAEEARRITRREMLERLRHWDLRVEDCAIPENAACTGMALREISLPTRFGASVVEVERPPAGNIDPGPDTRLYPGDRVALLGHNTGLTSAREFLTSKRKPGDTGGAAVTAAGGLTQLDSYIVENSPKAGRTLAALNITRETGARIAGIERAGERKENPSGSEVLLNGDGLLLVGTPAQLDAFKKWLAGGTPEAEGNTTAPA